METATTADTGSSNTTARTGSPDFIEKCLECPLCLSLICEPLSISCGHSFCRVCLVKSLRRSKKKCPQCRAVCHISAEDAQENFMIKDLAMHTNPIEYAARLLEAEAEKSAWMTLLPIFYYNETLFPGGRLDLHLFEPRYRVMMQRVVNSTRSFAYVANFNQYRANVGDVALIAVLEEVEFMADGRCMLQAKLSSRMIITDHYVEEGTQGLHFCRLTPLCDEPMDEAQIPVVSQLVNLATLIIGSVFSGSIRALEERYGATPSSNNGAAGAEAFSLWMAAVCPLSDREKARLLKTTDTAERLRAAVGCFSTIMSRAQPDAGVAGVAGVVGVVGGSDSSGVAVGGAGGGVGVGVAGGLGAGFRLGEVDEDVRLHVPRRRRARRQPLRRPVEARSLLAEALHVANDPNNFQQNDQSASNNQNINQSSISQSLSNQRSNLRNHNSMSNHGSSSVIEPAGESEEVQGDEDEMETEEEEEEEEEEDEEGEEGDEDDVEEES